MIKANLAKALRRQNSKQYEQLSDDEVIDKHIPRFQDGSTLLTYDDIQEAIRRTRRTADFRRACTEELFRATYRKFEAEEPGWTERHYATVRALSQRWKEQREAKKANRQLPTLSRGKRER